MGESNLKDFDVELCCSKETVVKIELARDGLVQSSSRDGAHGWKQDNFWSALGTST
jgi:geranylgeranyl transferase type-1 subunit beta